MMMSNWYTTSIRLLLSIILITSKEEVLVVSQEEQVCSCSPLVYNWKLDFNKGCSPLNVTIGLETGIRDAFCSTSNITTQNLTPVKVTAYQIIELNFELTPLKSKAEQNISLADGDVITFASITAAEPNQYSGGFQVSLLGVNDALQGVVQEWLVIYTNLCEQIPYSVGDSIGWMVFVSDSIQIEFEFL